jgi:hypothetical protein
MIEFLEEKSMFTTGQMNDELSKECTIELLPKYPNSSNC